MSGNVEKPNDADVVMEKGKYITTTMYLKLILYNQYISEQRAGLTAIKTRFTVIITIMISVVLVSISFFVQAADKQELSFVVGLSLIGVASVFLQIALVSLLKDVNKREKALDTLGKYLEEQIAKCIKECSDWEADVERIKKCTD